MRRCLPGWALPCAQALAMAVLLVSCLAAAGPLASLEAQESTEARTAVEVRDRMLGHFNTSMAKFLALAEAMPAESFTWSPGEGVMEVGRVYMHVARYNYLYPSQNLGMALPPATDMDSMESVRDKDLVLATLARSRDWVGEQVAAMSADDLESETQLYGRTVPKWAVLTQLVSHMSEHLGQSIAYARMNGVVPPWSR